MIVGDTETVAPSSSLAQDIWFSARRLGFKSPWGYEAACRPPRLFSLAAVVSALGFLLITGACDSENRHGNSPPTVLIVAGPQGIVNVDTAYFAWRGADRDGNLLGYYLALDSLDASTFTGAEEIVYRNLPVGAHTFVVQAVDSLGVRSLKAMRSFECRYGGVVRPRGTDSTFDLATWNIENFPKAGRQTIDKVQAIVSSLELDLIAIQEIADTAAFSSLLAGLVGYGGNYSRDDYGRTYQKTGVIYRRNTVSVSNVRQILWGNDSVVRPPLCMRVVTEVSGRLFDFELIVVHLKSGRSNEDLAMRRTTCRLIKNYIDSCLAAGADPDFVVAGDFNDEVDREFEQNSFQSFIADSFRYHFLTRPLAGDSRNASYIGGGLIDHILVTRDALTEYGAGRVETIRLDDELRWYPDSVSDHRPVLACFVLHRVGVRH